MFNIRFLLLLSFFSCYTLVSQDTYIDNFSSVSYSNDDGNQNWSTNWIENGDDTDNGPTNQYINITGNRLRMYYIWTENIRRSANLSGATNATLSFDWETISLTSSQRLAIQISSNSGATYTTLGYLTGNTTGTFTQDISAYISANTTIRFNSINNNWNSNDYAYLDNVSISTTAPNAPPVVTATGNQIYCPSGTISIVETISITDPDDTTATEVSIQISSGYINGEDLLTLTGSHPTITPTWNSTEGKLTLLGPTTLTAFEAAVAAVAYSSSAVNPSGSRDFSITVGDANYLPNTGHYYEYISDVGITWTAARDAAALRTYFGLQGYLATLTSQVEANFSGTQALGVGWIGGSDAATEGTWQWVTGPETGTVFWNGAVGGSTPNFAFWNSGEPNQSGNEDYAHITHPNVNPNGSWNDLSNTGAASGNYQPQGYIVEYGGTVGDPIINVTAITSITIDDIDPTASNPLPLTVYCSSDVPAVDITVVADEADNCTANPTVTFIGDVSDGGSNPEIITRTYRITDDSGNTTNVEQTITVLEIGITGHPSNQIVFSGTNAIFSVNAYNADTYQWQVSTNGGVSYSSISDGVEYTGTQTSILTASSASINKNGNRYSVLVSNSASSCTIIVSNSGILAVKVSTVITNRRITLRAIKD